ncbi:MAG: hypothetical protein HY537_02995 [Deltaproteobacteria bacterium]|nr:hypothetical protein [Deltaproteobacteria bacterium]
MRALLVLFFVVLLAGCHRAPRTYSVGLGALPDKIDPRWNDINVYQLIYLHLYFPLFERSENQSLTSHFLDLIETRVHDVSFKSFRLCLKNRVRFSDGTEINAKDLESSLRETHQNKSNLQELESLIVQGRCIEAKLAQSDTAYFDKLTTTESTILKRGSKNSRIPVGLGPYQIMEYTKDRLLLEETPGLVQGDFKRLEFVKVDSHEDGIKKKILDWNHIYYVPIPDTIKDEYQTISPPIFKTYFILVKVKDTKLRQQIAACFPHEKFSVSLSLNLKPTPGFLPLGIMGTHVEFSEIRKKWGINCNFEGKQKQKLIYYSIFPEVDGPAKHFFEKYDGLFPVKILYQPSSINKLIEAAYSPQKELLALIGSDGDMVNAQNYFSSLYGDKLMTTGNIPGLDGAVKKAALAQSEGSKNSLFEEAHRLLLESGFVIPLGQFEILYYYPKNIRNVLFSDLVTGYPKIDKLKLR